MPGNPCHFFEIDGHALRLADQVVEWLIKVLAVLVVSTTGGW